MVSCSQGLIGSSLEGLLLSNTGIFESPGFGLLLWFGVLRFVACRFFELPNSLMLM